MTVADFQPPVWLRNPHLQTITGNRRRHLFSRSRLLAASREMVLTVAGGVRLQGFYAPQPQGAGRGLLLLLHGWEGSADSAYLAATGEFFYRRGYDIFRLNLRDHGRTHHLNEGLFRGTYIEEVYQAVAVACRLAGDKPRYLLGFSLGGNFSLRIGLQADCRSRTGLGHIFAICPALDPWATTRALDRQPLYRDYFRRKWCRSLRLKAAAFPRLYDFSAVIALPTCEAMTAMIVERYTEYENLDDYFSRYDLTGRALAGLQVPATIITAADDPVIDAAAFAALPVGDRLRVDMQPYGGHCGFMTGLPNGCWYESRIAAALEAPAGGSNA